MASGRAGADTAAAPLAVIGYSFGAWVGAQAAGQPADVRHLVAIAPPLRVFGDHVVLAGADHVLAGREDEVAATIRDRLGAG